MAETKPIRRLSSAQIAHFDTFGFLVFRGLFANEAPKIIDAVEEVWREHGGGNNRRRMFTMNFRPRCSDGDVEQLRRDVDGLDDYWVEKPCGDAMPRTAGPGRLVHLEQRLALGNRLPDLVAEAKKK